ncbi:sensor histidine kinase [Rhodoferax ferrireducens]|nr:HAMP domain-containing sensor histidine kinase [Rhodoferax ferrireducens]
MSIFTVSLQLYLKVFPRPKFEDQDMKRLSGAYSDINALTIISLLLYMLENLWVKASPPAAVMMIVFLVLFLIAERWAIYKGFAKFSVLSYAFLIGAFWLGLTHLATTIVHTQTMILCLGLAAVTIALGTGYGLGVLFAYVGLLLWGTLAEQVAGMSQIAYAQTIKHFAVATTILTVLFVVCAIMRRHLIEERQLALRERDSAREHLEQTNQLLAKLLSEKSEQLDLTVNETNKVFVKHEQFSNLGTLVSGLSHELGTPIGNAVLTSSNMIAWSHEMQEKLGQDPQREKRLSQYMMEGAQIISRNLDRANTLVTNFKQVSLDQLGSNRLTVNLADCIKQSIFALKPTLSKYGVRVKLRLDESIKMETFPFAIEQIVTNLVTNAVIHGLEKKPDGIVTIRTWIKSGTSDVCIEVADNGWGIHHEVVTRIFEPFFTTKRGRGGTGMGLSIVAHLATAILAGDIDVNTGPDGSKFIVTIPLSSPTVENDSSPPDTVPGFLQ